MYLQFILPAVIHISHQPRLQRGDGPIVSNCLVELATILKHIRELITILEHAIELIIIFELVIELKKQYLHMLLNYYVYKNGVCV